jgi:hypothetical protein
MSRVLPGLRLDTVPFAVADERFGLRRIADRFWGLEALYPAGLRSVRVHSGAARLAGPLLLERAASGITVVDGDVDVDGCLRWVQPAGAAVLVITGRLALDRLVLEGQPGLWLQGGLRASALLLTALSHEGSLVVRRSLRAPAWIQWQERGELLLPGSFRGRVIQSDSRMDLDAFPQAERASHALAADLPRPLRLTTVVQRVARGQAVLCPETAPSGPSWKGRPTALVTELSLAATDAPVAARIPAGTVWPQLRALFLGGHALNRAAAGWDLPALEELTVCGPHVPPGLSSDKGQVIPDDMFARMPRLARLRLLHFRSLPEAVFHVPTLRSLDLSQQLANPVFHSPPEPGLRLSDIERLRRERPALRLAFGDDVCGELPSVVARCIDELLVVARTLGEKRLAEAERRILRLRRQVEANRAVISDVLWYDLLAMAIFTQNGLSSTGRGAARRRHELAVLALAEEALACLGDPGGWFVSSTARAACCQLAMSAGNAVAWRLHRRDPQRALAAIDIAVAGAGHERSPQAAAIADTQVRVLLVLGRQEEAFAAAQRGLAIAPSFGPLQDIKTLPAFQKWQSARDM